MRFYYSQRHIGIDPKDKILKFWFRVSHENIQVVLEVRFYDSINLFFRGREREGERIRERERVCGRVRQTDRDR